MVALPDGERLASMETEMAEVRRDVEAIALDVKSLQRTTATKDDVRDIKTAFDRYVESCDSRYASKLVERIVYGMVALTLVAVFTALLALVVAGRVTM